MFFLFKIRIEKRGISAHTAIAFLSCRVEQNMNTHNRNLLIILSIALCIFFALNIGVFFKLGPTGLAVHNQSNTPPEWNSTTTYFGISAGTNLLLDLARYFIDADNDTLSFIATEPSNFTTSISGSMLTLTPDTGFTGIRPVTITASDSKDLTSQVILVDVLNALTDIRDNNNKFYGKKITNEPDFDTHFASIEQNETQLTIVFYHDSNESQDIWIEGDIEYTLSANNSAAHENMTLIVQLIKGIIPKFKLHIGKTSEIFEFGKNIPAVHINGGNYTLLDRDDELIDVELTKEGITAVIKGTDNTEINAKAGKTNDTRIKTDVFAAKNISMEEAVISLPFTGKVNAVLKCSDFNTETFYCEGSWEKTSIPFTKTEDKIIFSVNHFSGYAGGYIEIINVQSYPTLNGNWTVAFNVTGTENLTIQGTSGTHFTVDLQFLELKCGNNTINASYDGDKVFVSNFSCNETAYETSKVITEGRHYLNFTFGNSSAIARNLVITGAQSVTSVLNSSFFAEGPGDSTGFAIMLADINNDGKTDAVVGAHNRNESGLSYRGKFYLIYGPFPAGNHNISKANASWVGAAPFSSAGFSLAKGDFNNDGNEDIAAGAPLDNSSGVFQSGSAYLINGGVLSGASKNLGDSSNYQARFSGLIAGGNLGWSLATGDFNNDGVLDIAIGEPFLWTGFGNVYIFFGPFNGNYTTAMANVTFTGTLAINMWFGASLAVGDINGDGNDDLIIGSPRSPPAGDIFVFYGPFAPGPPIPDVAANIIISGEPGSGVQAGYSIHSGKDVNADGFDDLLIGDPNATSPIGATNSGKTYLMYGSAAWPAIISLPLNKTWHGENPNDNLGHSVMLNDENNDTLADAIMSAPGNNRGGLNAGSVYFAYAPIPSGPEVNVNTTNGSLYGITPGEALGTSLSGASPVGIGAAFIPYSAYYEPTINGKVYLTGFSPPTPPPIPTGGGGGGYKYPIPEVERCPPDACIDVQVTSTEIINKQFVEVSGKTKLPQFNVYIPGVGSAMNIIPGPDKSFTARILWNEYYTEQSITVQITTGIYDMSACCEIEKELCGENQKPKEKQFNFPQNFYEKNSIEWLTAPSGNVYAIFNTLSGYPLAQKASIEYCPTLFGEPVTIEQDINWGIPISSELYTENLCKYCAQYHPEALTTGISETDSVKPLNIGQMSIGTGGIPYSGPEYNTPVSLGYAIFTGIPKNLPSTGYAYLPTENSKKENYEIQEWWNPDYTGITTGPQISPNSAEFSQNTFPNPTEIISIIEESEITPICVEENHAVTNNEQQYPDSWIQNVDYSSVCAQMQGTCPASQNNPSGLTSITGSAVAQKNNKKQNAGKSITGSTIAGTAGQQNTAGTGNYGCGSGYGTPSGNAPETNVIAMANNLQGVPKHCEGLIICEPCPPEIGPKKTPEIEQPETPAIGSYKKPCPGLVPFCGVDGTAYLLYIDKNGLQNPAGFSVPDLKPVEPGLLGYLLGWTSQITGAATASTAIPQGKIIETINELTKKTYTNQVIANEWCVEEDSYCALNFGCIGKCPETKPPTPTPPPVPPPNPPNPGPPPTDIPGPPLPPDSPIENTINTRNIKEMPDYCSVVTWNRKGESISAHAVEIASAIPQGYELIAGPISFDCLEDDLDIKFNIPDNYKDIRAFRCIDSTCTAMTDVTIYTDELVCDGMPLSEHRRREMLTGDTYLRAAEIQAIEKYEALVSSSKKELSTQGYAFEFTGSIPTGIITGLFSPDFDIPLAANPSITIISTPLVVEFDKQLPKGIDAKITVPYKYTKGIDENTIAIYLLQESGTWLRLDTIIDKKAQIASAQLYDIAQYTQNNKLVFAVMAVKCDACIVSEFKNVYNPGSRNAIILVHGMTSSSKTWQFLIDDYVFNKQPWQIWTFDYPSYMTIDEMAKDLADSLQANNAKYDNIQIVGHSLGGFISQRALEIADEDPSVYSFIRKVRKTILIGNPGLGSPAAEVYKNLVDSLINIKSIAKLFDTNAEVLENLVSGRVFTTVPGVKYYAIAGSESYQFNLGMFQVTAEQLFGLLDVNDGIITTKSASFVGGKFLDNACMNYFEIKLTHTELIDAAIPRRIIARIISEEDAGANPDFAYLGYNKYVDLIVDYCSPEEYFILLGRKMPELERPAPLNCNCGNGVCGEGETYDNCPQDCASVFSLASFCMILPFWIILLMLLLAILTMVYIIRKRAQKKETSPVWKTALWFLILLIVILLLLLLFICKYIPWWYWLILLIIALAIIIDSLVPCEKKNRENIEELQKETTKTK